MLKGTLYIAFRESSGKYSLQFFYIFFIEFLFFNSALESNLFGAFYMVSVALDGKALFH
jgi:hypothetical protein